MTKLFNAHLASFNCVVSQISRREASVSVITEWPGELKTLPSNTSYLFKFKLNERSWTQTNCLFLSRKNCINYRQYVTWQQRNFISDYEGCSHFVSKNTLAFCTLGFAQPCQSVQRLLSGNLKNIFKQEKDFQIISFPKLLA